MSINNPKILVIDDQWGRVDDPMIPDRYGDLPFEWLLESAEDNGKYSWRKALAVVHNEQPSVILLDMNFGEQEFLGIEILEKLRMTFPVIPIIIFTFLESAENRELVIKCMELGANEYLEKAPSAAQMKSVLDVYTGATPDQALYGNSIAIRQLRAEIARVSFSGSVNVLIYGESGTGKELVASALHRQGLRRNGPFVPKNCAHSDSQLLESELFGHIKGAFTGAVGGRKGLFEEADDGMLFLDEVADIPLDLQAKLLRVLETRSFRPLGQNREIRSDFQLVCATNQSPVDLERNKKLRQDFYFRIATITLSVPPLRDRSDDIPILATLFLKRFKEHGAAGYPGEIFSERVIEQMLKHGWPGNVRELRNFVEKSLLLSRDAIMDLDLSDLPEPATRSGSDLVRSSLPQNPSNWSKTRLMAELQLCLEAKRQIQVYKGEQWKAEFMRLMYPECRAANAKGFQDLIKRLTQGPWGAPDWREQRELVELIEELSR
jgi:DNA-binding NtrC family response regulator